MAQALPSTSLPMGRPATPLTRVLPTSLRLSPSRMPEQVLTSTSVRNGHLNLDTFSPVNQNGSFEFDRVIKRGPVLRRVKKKGAWKPSWKPAYLVLRPNLLSVYKDADETALRASITLSDVTAVASVKKTNTENVFGVFTPPKNYHFSGFNAREASDWVSLLRIESRTGDDEALNLPPGLPVTRRTNPGSESTDMSADDDLEPSGSPEGPHWPIRGNNARNSSLSHRKPLHARDLSGNEAFTTSQSDLSDGLPQQLVISTSAPRPVTLLSPISDTNSPLGARPSFQRSTSQLSITQVQNQVAHQANNVDPNRVIRQSHIMLLKSVPGTGVRQWKSVWMVLRPSNLAMYKSSNEYEPLKIVPISDLIDAAEIDPVSKSKRFCFQVIGLEKAWRFNVDNEDQLEGWLGALKSVLTRRSRGRGQSVGQLGQMQSTLAPNYNSQSTSSFNGVIQSQLLPSGVAQPFTISSISKPTTATHQRPESGLDEIVEATEEMSIRQ